MSTVRTFLTALALAAPLGAQDFSIETFELENGMTVILHEDHTSPQVVVDIWYHVGSKDERPGRSGFAHLFEHLMFMGTERVSDFDVVMEAGGAWNNASTSPDRTNYFDVGPAEMLPTLLWLEADRMQGVGRGMNQEKLDLQREVVRNERRQQVENRPYGKSYLKASELLYPEGHPYHHPVIGSHEDLQAATVDDVKDFFATYYAPNNASMVVAGAFESEDVRPLIERLFGALPRGDDVLHRDAEPVQLQGRTVFTMTDAVQFASTSVIFHSPPFLQPGDAEMDLLAEILAGGVSSRLYQRLVVEEPLAVEVEARQSSSMLGSTFEITALARPGVDLARVEEVILAELEAVVRDGVTPDELAERQGLVERQQLSRLQSLRARADLMNQYELYYGDPDGFVRDLDRYRQATHESLGRFAREVFTAGHLALRVLPEPPPPSTDPLADPPGRLAPPPFEPTPPERFTLEGGLEVHLFRRTELPLVELELQLPFGAAADPAGHAGLAELTADMLDEGANGRSAVEFAAALGRLGASFRVSVSEETTRVGLASLARNFDEALALTADAVLRPTFAEHEWQRVKEIALADLRREADDPQSVAQVAGDRAFFGTEHPYGSPVAGTVRSVEGIELEDVRAFHAERWTAEGATLFVAGDLSPETARASLEAAFGSWARRAGDVRATASFPAPAAERASRIVFVDRPDSVQTVIRFLMPAPPYADPSRVERELLVTALGGTFTSRLNRNLREEKGWTYGAGASYRAFPSTGYTLASASVRADVTGPAVREFLREFAELRRAGVSEEETERVRADFRRGLIEAFASLGGTLNAALELERNGLPFAALADVLERATRAEPDHLSALAESTLPEEGWLLVLVGDRNTVLDQLGQLEDLELPEPMELDARGEPID